MVSVLDTTQNPATTAAASLPIPDALLPYKEYITQQVSLEALEWWNGLFTMEYTGPQGKDEPWMEAVTEFWETHNLAEVFPDCYLQFLLGSDTLPDFLWSEPAFARNYDPLRHQNVGPFWNIVTSFTAPRGRLPNHLHCCSCPPEVVEPFVFNLPKVLHPLWREMAAVEIMEQFMHIGKKPVPVLAH